MHNTSKKAKYAFLFSLLLYVATFFGPSVEARFPNSGKLDLPKEKIMRLRFYVQDWTGGENATVWTVASFSLTQVLPSAFRLLSVDGLGRSGQDPGCYRAGEYARDGPSYVGQRGFHAREYKGSTLSIVGRNPLDDE
ncbi:dirigent-like protein, partial [Striga asiatica]